MMNMFILKIEGSKIMEIAELIKIEKRTVSGGRANKRLRNSGFLPGNIYSRDMESIAVMVKKDELRKKLMKLGRSAIFKLELDGEKTYNAMVKDIQVEPLSGQYLHVDFQQVSLSEEIKANVSIRIEGRETLEMKKLMLLRQIDVIPVKGLPQDIPNAIDIDVSNMVSGDIILISDIKFPEGIISEMSAEQLVVSVSEPKEHGQEADDGEDSESVEATLES